MTNNNKAGTTWIYWMYCNSALTDIPRSTPLSFTSDDGYLWLALAILENDHGTFHLVKLIMCKPFGSTLAVWSTYLYACCKMWWKYQNPIWKHWVPDKIHIIYIITNMYTCGYYCGLVTFNMPIPFTVTSLELFASDDFMDMINKQYWVN